ncbi:MAG: DEAD/DEAH box helicase family protein [Melioribacteraceae bacterium]
MDNVRLEIVDSTCVNINSGHEIVKECLSYPCEFWRSGPRGKTKQTYNKSFVFGDKKTGFWCYAGFVDKIKIFCEKRSISFSLIGEMERLVIIREPVLIGIEIRDYQLDAIKSIVEKQRGIIHAATRSGKSIIAIGAASCFENPSILYLAPSIDIVNEIHAKFVECGFKACKLGDGNKKITEKIVISTVQTYSKLNLIDLAWNYNVLFADEIHLMSAEGGSLEKILSTCMANVRIGFSATLPKKIDKQLMLQGLLGDTIMELSVKDGIEKHGVLSKPKVDLLVVPISKVIADLKTYREIYEAGIIKNTVRNNIIAKYTKSIVDLNQTVLIFCNNLEHISLISQCLNKIGVIHETVEGKVSGEDRQDTKEKLKSGEIKCVISSTVWTEGVTLPDLACVINSSGQKSEERLLQKMGRGLGKTEEKSEVIFVDFLDPYKHLSAHAISRISIYKNMGWL